MPQTSGNTNIMEIAQMITKLNRIIGNKHMTTHLSRVAPEYTDKAREA